MLSLIEKMLELGSDPNAEDCYGNNCLHRVCLDIRQIITNPSYEDWMEEQLFAICKTFINAGADLDQKTESREAPAEFAANLGVEKYLG